MDEGDGLMPGRTVDAYLRALPPRQRAIAARLRRIVKAAAPDAIESIKWAQPVYESNGPFAFMKKATAHVTFGFWRGVELDAGRGILESSGSVMAHMKIRSEDEIDDRMVARLVKDAVRLNREKGDPTKRR